MVERVRAAVVGDLNGNRVGLLGLTVMPNADDMRDSAVLDLLLALVAAGARVHALDPEGM